MRSLLYIFIVTVLAGCSYSGYQPKELDDAQRLMASDPEMALSRLSGVDISELRDSATMARWALLYSEAIVANRLTAPTDTIVNIAIDYYGRHDMSDEYQKAIRLRELIHASDTQNELATSIYLRKETEFMLYKERVKREQYVFIGIIILLIAGGIIVWMRQRLKLQSAQNDILMADVSELKGQIEARCSDINRLETTLYSQLENRFTLIDSLCQVYYESQGLKNERKAILNKVKSEIEVVRTDSFPEMERAVNSCRNNLLQRVKEAIPGIKTEDYQLTVFLASGLSIRTISLLLGESVDVIYKRKSRLKKRFSAVAISENADFESIF